MHQGPSLAQLAETAGASGETLPDAPKLAVSRAAPRLPERRATSNGLLKRARKHYGTRLVCTALADNRQVTESRSDAPQDDPGSANAAGRPSSAKLARSTKRRPSGRGSGGSTYFEDPLDPRIGLAPRAHAVAIDDAAVVASSAGSGVATAVTHEFFTRSLYEYVSDGEDEEAAGEAKDDEEAQLREKQERERLAERRAHEAEMERRAAETADMVSKAKAVPKAVQKVAHRSVGSRHAPCTRTP